MTKPASNRFFFIPCSNERADIPFATMHSITASLTIGLSIAQLSLAASHGGAWFDNFSITLPSAP